VTAGRRRWLNAVIVIGVVAIAVAAVINFVRSDGSAAPVAEPPDAETETQPPDTGGALPGQLPEIVTLPSDLRQEGGLLWWAGGNCEASVLDLSSGLVVDAPAGTCDIWPSPGGATAIATAAPDESNGMTAVVPFTYPPPEGATVLVGEKVVENALPLLTPSAWHPGRDRVAVCSSHAVGTFVDVLDLEDGTRDSVANIGGGGITGFCQASFLEDGRLAVVRDGVRVEIDGRQVFGVRDATRLLPDASPAITALGAGDGMLAVGLRSDQPAAAAIAAITPDGIVDFFARLRPESYPAVVGVAPDGRSLWYLDATSGSASILEIPGGRRSETYRAGWLAWSPDGNYLAKVVREGIEIVSLQTGRLLTTLDVPANIVSWTKRPGDG
jgi:hypothetical protein